MIIIKWSNDLSLQYKPTGLVVNRRKVKVSSCLKIMSKENPVLENISVS